MDTTRQPTPADDYSLLLERVADELLSQRAERGELKAAVEGLYSLCSALSGIDEHPAHAGDADGTRLPSGEAISPRDAARCVLDYGRTSKFLRGLHAAIHEARKRFPDTAIEVLYAGCGPFAPLAIPLTTRFSSDELRFTLLDAHQPSLDAARRIFQALEKEAFVRDYVQCDAASYRSDATRVIHVVVAEAMQAALEREPQAAITLNLAPQLRPGGLFLPERVSVDCHLCDLTKEFPPPRADAAGSPSVGGGRRVRINLGRVLELTAEGFRNPSASGDGDGRRVTSPAPTLLRVPEHFVGEFNLMLSTAITVFDSVALGDYESGLTCPRILFDAGRMRGGEVIEFEYQLGDRPGFRYRSL